MSRKKIEPRPMRILVQAADNRWEWITTKQFANQEVIILKADGFYVPVKF